MSFLWPQYLWMLLAAPLLIWAYVALLNRRKRALNYASLRTIKEALGPGARWRRHVPPGLLLVAVCAALLATARPVAMVTLPSEGRMIVLAMDVSRSMLATDVKPDRITAAKAAAKTFVQEVPANVKIAIISFALAALAATGLWKRPERWCEVGTSLVFFTVCGAVAVKIGLLRRATIRASQGL